MATSPAFDIIVSSIEVLVADAYDIQQTQATVRAYSNSQGGTTYFAIRADRPWTESEAGDIKAGTNAVWSDSMATNPTRITVMQATGLTPGTVQHLGVVQELGAETSNVAVGEPFTTLSYPQVGILPYQVNDYPDRLNYRDVPVHEDLSYGVGGDAPITLAVDRLPLGMSMDSQGRVSGSPEAIESVRDIRVTATNQHGSTALNPFTWTIDRLTGDSTKLSGMTRSELFETAKLYADRYDLELSNNLDKLLTTAEARLRMEVMTREMVESYTIPVVDDREYYQLPEDFEGLQNIEIQWPLPGRKTTPTLITPEQANRRRAWEDFNYLIENNMLRMVPTLSGEGSIVLSYYRTIPPLVKDDDTNWLITRYSSLYITALVQEVARFAHNIEGVAFWQADLEAQFASITAKDTDERWSGTSMAMRLE